jgi:transcriptional regulator with GAF, ATPase, and Fis domain
VHQLSGRRGAFVAVNCGALPDTLIETELFGYRKGAFSGAAEDRPGLIRSADQGTLFLDEIGDLPGPSQAPLLRVLQEREVTPVGATRPVPVDLRVVAATHRDLPALVDAGTFRNDLWARLSGFKMVVPPLRERRDDLGLLVSALLRRRVGAEAESVGLAPRAARALFFHDWPLNVRELEKCVASGLVLSRGAPVGLEHLPEAIQQSAAQPRPAAASAEPADQPLSEDEQRLRERIIALLKEHKGNIAAVARAMGKARMQIHRWVKRYGIEPDAFRA